MVRYQEKVLAEFERIAAEAHLEVAVAYDYANTGKMVAQRGFTTVTSLVFSFQQGHNRVEFAGLGHGPGLRSALFSETDDGKVALMFKTWRFLCAGGDKDVLYQCTSNDVNDGHAALDVGTAATGRV